MTTCQSNITIYIWPIHSETMKNYPEKKTNVENGQMYNRVRNVQRNGAAVTVAVIAACRTKRIPFSNVELKNFFESGWFVFALFSCAICNYAWHSDEQKDFGWLHASSTASTERGMGVRVPYYSTVWEKTISRVSGGGFIWVFLFFSLNFSLHKGHHLMLMHSVSLSAAAAAAVSGLDYATNSLFIAVPSRRWQNNKTAISLLMLTLYTFFVLSHIRPCHSVAGFAPSTEQTELFAAWDTITINSIRPYCDRRVYCGRRWLNSAHNTHTIWEYSPVDNT